MAKKDVTQTKEYKQQMEQLSKEPQIETVPVGKEEAIQEEHSLIEVVAQMPDLEYRAKVLELLARIIENVEQPKQ